MVKNVFYKNFDSFIVFPIVFLKYVENRGKK